MVCTVHVLRFVLFALLQLSDLFDKLEGRTLAIRSAVTWTALKNKFHL